MKMTLCSVFGLITIYTRILTSVAAIDGALFQQDLQHLANDILGLQKFQNHVDQQDYGESDLDGATLVSDLASRLQDKFHIRMEVVEILQEKIEELYSSTGDTAYPETCCKVPRNDDDERFGSDKINLNAICTSGPGVTESSAFLSQAIIDVMKKNLEEYPQIKWQYFGSEKGILATYPASNFCEDTYDPRLRPWYIETATPEPKDVVLVLDTSGSMGSSAPGGTRLSTAIQAANTVIDTLNSNDRVGVVAFSDSVQRPQGTADTSPCYKTNLAKAIPKNNKRLSDFVNLLNTGSNTEYILALDAAFDYFHDSPAPEGESKERHRVILFLTDGDPTDKLGRKGILNTIRDRNAALNNTVVILTYGIGDITKEGEETLTHMAEQTNYSTSAGEVTAGLYTKVSDLDNLRYTMASFYKYFRPGQNPSPIFTVPYIDAYGIGLVISACLPVFGTSDTLSGITCLDMAVGDLLGDLTHFRQGELSYVFLTDEEGILLTHPLLRGPQEVNDDPVYILMTVLERADEAVKMMESMIRGESGNATMTSLRVRARGDVRLTGVQWKTLKATYDWTLVRGTDFAICVVIGDGDIQTSLRDTDTFPPTFTYHRLDLKEPSNPCKHFNRFSIKDRSSVKFTGDAFVDPFVYQNLQETIDHGNSYEVYMTGGLDNPGFKKAYEQAIWFYIGTVDGIFRIFPGVQLPKKYDHKLRPWYKTAAGEKGLLSISTPYEDAFGAGLIVTLGSVILEGRIAHKSDDPSIGVLAMDFPLSYMYNLLITRFPMCEQIGFSCFLLDRSGFVVAHRDFVQTDDPSEIANVHITVKEKYIAKDLINANLMQRSSCMDVEEFRYQHFWTVSIPSGSKSRITEDYEIHEVENSNIFVVMKKYSGNKPATCFCKTPKGMNDLGVCKDGVHDTFCECPCYSTHLYNYCTGDLDLDFDDPPPCTPPLPNVDYEGVRDRESDIKSLENCFDYKCQEKTTQGNCNAVVACTWCPVYVENSSFCSSSGECDDGDYTTTSSDDKTDENSNKGVNDFDWIIGVVIGAVVLLILVTVVIIVLKRKGIICRKYDPNEDSCNSEKSHHL